MTQDERVSLSRQADPEILSLDSTFSFHCHAGLACFNQCCRLPTIVLSPYDILRLKQSLGIGTGEILRRYTRLEIEESSNLPLIFIDAFRAAKSGCPFLEAGGCTVYAHRPAACRLFPVAMGSQFTEQGVVDYYFCRRLEYCRGFDSDVQWTLESWMANQGFVEYDQGRRGWLEILLRQGMPESAPIDGAKQNLFAAIAYDLDRFREMITEPTFRQAHEQEVDENTLADLREDDFALLQFSYRFLKDLLLPG
jgi:Fe-S-cluster containining protein